METPTLDLSGAEAAGDDADVWDRDGRHVVGSVRLTGYHALHAERLFEVEPDRSVRTCRTCMHSTPRHGKVRKLTYPLVCLLKACAVPYECGDGTSRMLDYPCGSAHDRDGMYPRGWAAR